jgi:hypothetical protein
MAAPFFMIAFLVWCLPFEFQNSKELDAVKFGAIGK